MPLDAVCLHAVLSELDARIAGGRIEKVYQPDREEIRFGAEKVLVNCCFRRQPVHHGFI